MGSTQDTVDDLIKAGYEHGFVINIEQDTIPPGLDEDIIRRISAKKGEPEWMLEYRLKAYRHWLTMEPPRWAHLGLPEIDFQAISYYSAPKRRGEGPKSLDEVDPELIEAYNKLGIPLEEQKALAGVAVDAVLDSVSVATTFREKLAEAGVIFCSMSEAIREYPELVQKYLGSVVPHTDNYFACLNAAVFSDGTFVYIPEGVKCPMELSTYFRINEARTGQFERTLIVAEAGSQVSYLEGCTAPMRDENQLHAAVVELVAMEDAYIKYSTVQNWYPGDEQGRGGILNFVTKRGLCKGARSRISWTQVETGSAITWKYPSCILKGDDSVGEFYSVAVTRGRQQADTGTKMIHIGRNTRSTIVSKGISAGHGQNTYRGLVRMAARAENARNHSQCDSLLIGDKCGAHTFPYIEVRNPTAQVEHEATTSKLSEDQLFYCRSRGLSEEDAVSMLVNGFCKEVFQELPMEFAVEAQKLLNLTLEGAVG
ncbi:MAG: Fe-S cluster assembly protein SufB [Gammaproteobacteria bacterium]|nr:MAG: Fe-S cluster assembly protein SufB [Gammaproteobacteria bacterium]